MRLIGRLWREQRVAFIAFCVALSLTLFFGGRIVLRAVYWANPEHHRQDPAPWMTPGYLARSWHLPNAAVDGALGLDAQGFTGPGRPTLERIAAVRGVPVQTLIEDLRKALPALRELPPGADPDAPPAAASPSAAPSAAAPSATTPATSAAPGPARP